MRLTAGGGDNFGSQIPVRRKQSTPHVMAAEAVTHGTRQKGDQFPLSSSSRRRACEADRGSSVRVVADIKSTDGPSALCALDPRTSARYRARSSRMTERGSGVFKRVSRRCERILTCEACYLAKVPPPHRCHPGPCARDPLCSRHQRMNGSSGQARG